MATLTGSRSANTGLPAHSAGLVMLQGIVDMAVVEATAGITIGSTDTFQVIGVPKGFVAFLGGWEVITAETGATTAQVEMGDGVDPNRYVASATVAATGDAVPLALAANIPYMYTADDTVDLLASVAAPTNAKIRMWVVGFNPNDIGSTADTADNNTWS